MSYAVIRTIHFSYGHRLVNHPGKCARLHGHNGRAEIEISAEKLNSQNMVMDFYDIKRLIGAWIDEHLDHRMILDEKDPLAAALKKAGDPAVTISEAPTAEAIARLIYEAARKQKIPVTRVTLWETESSAATYAQTADGRQQIADKK